MKINGFDLADPKFKYEDKVWCYFDPRRLQDHVDLPVFECEVWSWKTTIESHYGKAPEATFRYEVCVLDSLDGASWEDEEKLFTTKEDAVQFALNQLEGRAESAVERGKALTDMVAALSAEANQPSDSEGGAV